MLYLPRRKWSHRARCRDAGKVRSRPRSPVLSTFLRRRSAASNAEPARPQDRRRNRMGQFRKRLACPVEVSPFARAHRGGGPPPAAPYGAEDGEPVGRGVSSHFAFEFQPALVFFEKGAESVGCVEQAHPLFVVKRDRKAAQPVDAHASLLAHLEFQAALLLWASLVFEFSDARHQFFFAWFRHRDSLRRNVPSNPRVLFAFSGTFFLLLRPSLLHHVRQPLSAFRGEMTPLFLAASGSMGNSTLFCSGFWWLAFQCGNGPAESVSLPLQFGHD